MYQQLERRKGDIPCGQKPPSCLASQTLRSTKSGKELTQVALIGDGKAHMGAFFAVASTHDEGEAVAACMSKDGRVGHVVGWHEFSQGHHGRQPV
jgi:hypothetical protein